MFLKALCWERILKHWIKYAIANDDALQAVAYHLYEMVYTSCLVSGRGHAQCVMSAIILARSGKYIISVGQ